MTELTRREWMTTVTMAALAPRAVTGAATTKPMAGSFMILSTPYTETNSMDSGDLAGQVAFVGRCGADGIVWPQNSSEQRYLSQAERMRGFEMLAEANAGRRTALVLGVQADNTKGMLEYARHAESLEPDGMIAIPPTTATTLDDFRDYYRALAEVTDRPVFVQTSGGAPDVVPTTDFIVEMAKAYPNLAYVKEERAPVHDRMLALAEHRPATIKRIFGAAFGRQWLYEMRLGMDGVMTGGAMYADIYARLWELHTAGRTDELRDLYAKLLLMLNLDSIVPGVRLYMLKKRGIFKTTRSRRGDYTFSDDQIAEIEYRWAALREHLRA